MNLSCFDDFTVEEALDFALNCDVIPKTDPDSPGFETAVLCQCLERFQIPKDSRKSFHDAVVQILRPMVGCTVTNEKMADAAQKIASALLKFAQIESKSADETIMAAVQMTAAIMTLIKKHEKYEKRICALDDIGKFGIPIDKLRIILAVSEPTQQTELIQSRLERFSLSSDFTPNMNLQAIEAWMISNPLNGLNDDFILNFQSFTSENINHSIQSLPQYINTFMHAPHDWLYDQYLQMNDLAKHALWLIIAKMRSLSAQSEIAETCFESWLKNEAANIKTARQWLDNRMPSGYGTLTRVFAALYKRENGDTNWYAAWLRDIDSEFPADNDTIWMNTGMAWNDFETYWHAEAWRCSNSRLKAVEMLQERLASGSDSPQLWIILADILIDLNNFGLAEHAIEQAAQNMRGEDARICQALEVTQQRLGKEALKSAKQSRNVENALLELAMKFGNSETIADAALCAFDSNCEPVEMLAKVLSESMQARALFIQKIANRRDLEHLDNAYRLCQALEELCGNEPELRLFEAVCQLDNPSIAAQTLEQAMRCLNDDKYTYWTAVDLWIDLMADQNAWYEAVSGIAESFQSSDHHAVQSLMHLIACLPREARPMMQSILFETIGPEKTKQIFDRARNPIVNSQTVQISTLDIQELGLSVMPVFWQMLHRASRLNSSPSSEDSARAARRESVMAARGIAVSKYEKAPEPAQWVISKFSKASDAFNS